jgi:hypothetical protein
MKNKKVKYTYTFSLQYTKNASIEKTRDPGPIKKSWIQPDPDPQY